MELAFFCKIPYENETMNVLMTNYQYMLKKKKVEN